MSQGVSPCVTPTNGRCPDSTSYEDYPALITETRPSGDACPIEAGQVTVVAPPPPQSEHTFHAICGVLAPSPDDGRPLSLPGQTQITSGGILYTLDRNSRIVARCNLIDLPSSEPQ